MRQLFWRGIFRQLHLWLGLILAVYAVLIGISGAVIVFKADINILLRPELHHGPPPQFRADLGQALANIRQQFPDWKPLSISWPHEESPYWMVFLLKASQSLEVYVDTNTGNIIGSHDPRSGWLGWIESLHSNLRLARQGRLLNGYAALGLLALAFTGIFLVAPRLKYLQLRHLLRPRELHYFTGATVCIFLVGLSFTGAYYTWSQLYIQWTDAVLVRTPGITLAPSPGTQPAPTLGELVRIAQNTFPGKVIHLLPVPDARYPLRVTFREGSQSEFHLVSNVVLDPRTAKVLRVQHLKNRPAGDSFLGWLSAFHFGTFGGVAVRILWALVGVAIALLGPTGFWIWWRRRFRKSTIRITTDASS